MNKQESDILNVILQYHCRNQRALAERCGFSLGMVNRSVKALQGQGFLTTDMECGWCRLIWKRRKDFWK